MLASCTDEQLEASTRPDDFFCTREAQSWKPCEPKARASGCSEHSVALFFFLLLALCDVGEKGYN